MPFDDAQKAEIAAILQESLKSSLPALLTEGLKPTIAGLEKSITDKVTAATKGFKTAKDTDTDTDTDTDDDEPAGKGKGKGKGADPKILAKVAQLEKQVEDEKKAREAAETKSREERVLNSARAALRKAGVPEERVKAAIAVLHNAEGRLRLDDSDRPGLHFQRNGYDEVVEIEKGLDEWLKTDDGKVFLPPRGTEGTGEGTSNGPKVAARKDGKLDWNNVAEAAARNLARALN
jgi:hypothetical protein